jgi:hypothetical protein
MEDLARLLLYAGLGLVALGGVLWLLGRIPGSLPGDFSWKSGNTTVYVPLTTMLIVSIVLTVLVNVILRLLR